MRDGVAFRYADDPRDGVQIGRRVQQGVNPVGGKQYLARLSGHDDELTHGESRVQSSYLYSLPKIEHSVGNTGKVGADTRQPVRRVSERKKNRCANAIIDETQRQRLEVGVKRNNVLVDGAGRGHPPLHRAPRCLYFSGESPQSLG